MIGWAAGRSWIYALKDPRDGVIRYIGRTTRPDVRLQNHKGSRKRDSTPKGAWLRELSANGVSPVMEILKECSLKDAGHEEAEAIAREARNNDRLMNISRPAAIDGPSRSRPSPAHFRILVALDAARQISFPWPPTLEMVATIARLKSRSAVTYHLPALKVGGWVESGPHNRGLRLTASGKRALKSGKVKP